MTSREEACWQLYHPSTSSLSGRSMSAMMSVRRLDVRGAVSDDQGVGGRIGGQMPLLRYQGP